MDVQVCRICAKNDDNLMHILQTEGLQGKIETCLPIVIFEEYLLPDTICNKCVENVDTFYKFVRNCVENIIELETQYDVIVSCVKSRRKVDKSVTVFCENSDQISVGSFVKLPALTPVPRQTKDETPIPNFSCSLVDYDYSSNSETEPDETDNKKTDDDLKTESNTSACDIINEIVERKFLKRKSEDIPYKTAKIPRLESDSSSRRKNKQPKKVEYHLGTKLEDILPVVRDSYFATEDLVLPERLLNLPPEISITREVPEASSVEESFQTCLLCEQQFLGVLTLATHMYETHGIDLAQVYAGNIQPTVDKPTYKNRKIPELVKISDVLGPRRQKNQEYLDEPPVLEPQEKLPSSLTISKNPYTCSDCQEMQQLVTFPTFREYSSHRRSQHQIFHCDLCPKFYGRNSHLWKHVNRVHKGHPSITCQRCFKTSASKYHLVQHFNKMHSIKATPTRFSPRKPGNTSTPDSNDDDEDLLNKKFQGFDFKSVRQSFLRQELVNKHKYVSILKKNVMENGEDSSNFEQSNACIKKEPEEVTEYPSDSEECEDEPKKGDSKTVKLLKSEEVKSAPKEIDSSSNLYTNIITNYTPPRNEGPFKCPKCFKGFHKKHLVKKHKTNCRPRLQKDLLTRCKTCSRIFKDRQSLAKHLINYHSEYTCEICNVAVQSKCEIVSHIRFSHPNSDLTCYCGQILRSKSDLAKHKSDHYDSHVCQFCGDMLPTKIKLKMHILSLHRKILSLSCGLCLKLFETQHILKDHVRLVHADQLTRLTSCTVCGKNYGSKWKTFDHLNKSHGRIFKACKACLEVFETEQDLQRHFHAEHLNSKSFEKKVIYAGKNHEEKGSCSPERQENSQNVQDSNQVEQSSSESDDEDATSGETTTIEPQKPSDEPEYHNYIKDFKSNNEKKTQNGFGKHTDTKNIQDNKLSLLEKRLMGKKITEDDIKSAKTQDKTKIKQETSESVYKRSKNTSKDEPEDSVAKMNQNDGDILQNSSKRTVYVNSNDPSLCEICLKVWPAKKHLWQHYIRCHKQVAATVCGICLKTNPSYSSLQTHLRETHPNLLHGCGFGSNFICKICGRYHNASSKLKLHMAIHVGFNESILEKYSDSKEVLGDAKPQIENENSESEPERNIPCIKTELINAENEDDIIYESLIEEVEVSSESETEEVQNQENVLSVTSKQSLDEQEMSSSENDESDTEDQLSENELTENEMEQEMLKNMIGENSHMKTKIEPIEVKAEVLDCSDVSQEISYESQDYTNLDMKAEPSNDSTNEEYELDSCKLKMEVCEEWMNTPQKQFLQTFKSLSKVGNERIGLFECKPDELDNAIRSISFDQCENNENIHNGDFSDMQTSCLNDSELETAVGSIL